MPEIRCRCCGVPVDGLRAQVRVCMICDQCDGRHGDALQIALAHGMRDGVIDPGMAMCRMIVDDAHMTGRIVLVVDEVTRMASVLVPNPPPRWLVVCGRAIARGELPDLQTVVQVILARYIPGTRADLPAIARELREALTFVDPSIMDVEVDSKLDALDPHHLIINITAKTPVLGASIALPGAEDVAIPADILSRTRGQA